MDNKDSYSPQECNVSVNGSFAAESGAGRYEKGATVAISAGIREGYVFSGWKTTAFGLTLDNTNSPDATFTMPTGNVTITANWTRVATYNVSVNNSYADGSGAGKYVQGATVTISAGARKGHLFAGWRISAPGVALSDASSATTTLKMPAGNVTVTANWTYDVAADQTNGVSKGRVDVVESSKKILKADGEGPLEPKPVQTSSAPSHHRVAVNSYAAKSGASAVTKNKTDYKENFKTAVRQMYGRMSDVRRRRSIRLRPYKSLMEYILSPNKRSLGDYDESITNKTVTVKVCIKCKNFYPEQYESCERCGAPLQLYKDYINNFNPDEENAINIVAAGQSRTNPYSHAVQKRRSGRVRPYKGLLKSNFKLAINELTSDIDEFTEHLKPHG